MNVFMPSLNRSSLCICTSRAPNCRTLKCTNSATITANGGSSALNFAVTSVKKIYFDTNQLYYIRRIAEEGGGSDYGDYEWAYRLFPKNPQLVEDIRGLCYIVAFQYEWDLDFSSSNASFSEIALGKGARARATRHAWKVFAEGLNENQPLKQLPFLPTSQRLDTMRGAPAYMKPRVIPTNPSPFTSLPSALPACPEIRRK